MRNGKQRKPRSKNTDKYYFTQVHEDAVLKYVKSNLKAEREYLYKYYIGPAFNEMVDKIVYTYKFTVLPNIKQLMEECKIWLVTILEGFNPEKSKAFSYFSVITKNWFIHKVKDNTKQSKTEIIFEDINISKEKENLNLSYSLKNDDYKIHDEFFKFLYTEIDEWLDDKTLKDNDIKVLKAIQILFTHSEEIEIFNKKAVYFYLRELTKLNTKQVTSSLTKFRSLYKEFRYDWNNQWYF